jgi:hypothetical protein
MIRRTLLVVLLAVFLLVCGVAWYWFRPEKAFVNDTVNEPPPRGCRRTRPPSRVRLIPRRSLG